MWVVAIDSGEVLIWDHTQDPAADAPRAALSSADPQSWSADYPPAVLDVMSDAIDDALAAGDVEFAVRAGRDAACRQIEWLGDT